MDCLYGSPGPETSQMANTLVMACNERYALPAACVLYSIGTTSPDIIDRVILLGSDMSESSKGDLTRIAEAVDIPLELRSSASTLEAAGDLPVHGWVSIDAWTRLFIPDLCPELEHCLYVDADILCLSSLSQLFETKLEGNIVGAVKDVFHPTWGMSDCFSTIGLRSGDERRPYFNSGVLLMDCKAWREAEITARAISFARQYARFIQFWDQDALNAVIKDRWFQLDAHWNVPPLQDMLGSGGAWFTDENRPEPNPKDMEAGARIIHFVGDFKPWKPGYAAGDQLKRYQQTTDSIKSILEFA
jgi:lipopolysaccharide biosynthesis glycosyltransferase